MNSSNVTSSRESVLAALVGAADDPIFGLGLNGTVLSWNAAAERVFGYAEDEIVGTNAVRFLPPGSPNDLPDLLERVGRGEVVRQYETVQYTRDLRLVRVIESLAPVPGEDGSIVAAAVVLHEVGEVQDHEGNRLAAEQRFRAILDIAPVALLIVDDHGRIEFANPKAAELFGYDRYELLTLELTDLLPERVAPRGRAGGGNDQRLRAHEPDATDEAGRTDEPDELARPPDALGRQRDGTEFPIDLGINTLMDGRRRLIAAAIVDLSARRAAEEDLRIVARQQAALADLGRSALEGIELTALFDDAVRVVARVLDVPLAAILELPPDRGPMTVRAGIGWRDGVVGRVTVPTAPTTPAGAALRGDAPVIVDDLSGDDRFEPQQHLRDHGAAGALAAVIHVDRGSFGVLAAYDTGPRRWRRHDVTFVRGVGNVVGAAIARRQSEEELRNTTETLSTLVAAAPVGVAVLDVEGRVRVWNPAAEAIYGIAASDLVGREILASDAVGPEASALLRRMLDGDTVRGQDIAQRRGDGSEMSVRLHGAPLRDSFGAIVGTVVILVDITATRRLEEQLLQAQKMESVGRLAGGVAHDFNNLLTGMFGYTSLLADALRDGDPDQRDLVQGIRESAEKAAALTAQLLAFSRRQVLQPRVVDVNDVVRGIEPLLRRIIGETVTLVTVPKARIGHVRADPTQLEQVVVNLVVNARDAMPDGGTVVVETDEMTFDEAYAQEHFDVNPGRYVMLAVTDSGIGMDADTRMHLFEPFFTTKGPGKGTGLGLATTYGIVKQSGGHIWLYSEPDRGTTFKLYFPCVVEPAERPAAPEPIAAEPANNETILLVEDEAAVREITKLVLGRHGYRVLVAENGSAALALSDAHRGTIDLLITDVVMPGIGGRALAEQLQRRRPGLRTLFISGYTEDAIVRRGVLDANVSFLPKPFSPDALARTVREVLGAPARPLVPTSAEEQQRLREGARPTDAPATTD